MSTTPTPPTIQQTQEELKAAAVAVQTPPAQPETPPPAPPPPAPDWGSMAKQPDGSYIIKTKFGEEFKGSADEVVAKLAEAKVRTREHYEAKAAQQPPAAPPPPPPAEDPAEKAARDFILNSIAKELGLESGEEFKQRLTVMSSTAEDFQSQSLAASFLAACPDYPNSKESNEALIGVMNRAGLPNTIEGLKAAHAIALYEKVYQPLPPTPTQPRQMPTPPPTLPPSTSPISAGQRVNPWAKETSLEQLRQAAIEAESRNK